MPDLSSGFDYPNPYGLLASDLGYNMDEYGAALKFLSDLAGGTAEAEALELNGGTPAMLVGWQRNQKFRRVYGKCQRAGSAERTGKAEQEATRAREAASAATEGEGPTEPQGQRFIPLEDVPVNRSVFVQSPAAGSWGGP